MYSWIDGLLSVILDRSTEELLAAVLIALGLAAAGSSLGRWLCRSKREEQVARMTGVLLVAILASMAVASTYVEMHHQEQKYAPITDRRPPTFPPIPPGHFQYMTVLDINGDGMVDPQELHDAAVILGTIDRSFPGPHPSSPRFNRFQHDGRGKHESTESTQSTHMAQDLHEPANAPWGSPPMSR